MKSFLRMLQKDNHALSLARFCSLISFAIFAVVTIYLVFSGKAFAEYKTLAGITLGYCCVTLVNKGVDIWGIKVEADKKKGDEKNETK